MELDTRFAGVVVRVVLLTLLLTDEGIVVLTEVFVDVILVLLTENVYVCIAECLFELLKPKKQSTTHVSYVS